jgi:hypothetical protein
MPINVEQAPERTTLPVAGDPTRNVDNLVSAEARHQDSMRAAETMRIDQLAELRRDYETQISNILSAGVKDKSDLVSSQLVQIQNTFDTRVAKLEEFRLTTLARSSVTDPALASALADLATAQKDGQKHFATTLDAFASRTAIALETMSSAIAGLKVSVGQNVGERTGKRELIAYMVAGAGILIPAIVYVVVTILSHVPHP